MHSGSIKVESSPGQGATFVVRLPREQPTAAEA
jgi:signal transduction histidine kinase